MISRPKDPFISLVRKPEGPLAPTEAKQEPEAYGPSLYISDIKLPIVDEDLNQTLTAEIKLKVKRVSKNVTNGKTDHSYDFEVKGIRFKE